jgi:hypothetical protein
MTVETYNGWTNYETWLANLWMAEGDIEYYFDQVRELRRDKLEPSDIARHIADNMRSDYGDQVSDAMERGLSGMMNDLLNAALCSVNWREIAEHIVDDCAE